ncbi:MAG: cation:dicarboxylase symporter family transporter, partial [Novosphingobium sp.]|nr:cation:dicarboxylase symporter family transporter [Novosphingobium sp.]
MDRRLTLYILIGMVLGVVAGWLVFAFIPKGVVTVWPFGVEADLKDLYLKSFGLLSSIFLSLIKMLVAPLILSTIVVGIAHMGDSAALGRIGFRAIAWFIIASLISIGLGLVMVNFFQPGVGVDVSSATAASVGTVAKLDFFDFILHIFPKNAFEAMATNNILQILVFSLFAGVALSAIGEKGAALVRGADALAEMMLQITGYVMRFAPFAVF